MGDCTATCGKLICGSRVDSTKSTEREAKSERAKFATDVAISVFAVLAFAAIATCTILNLISLKTAAIIAIGVGGATGIVQVAVSRQTALSVMKAILPIVAGALVLAGVMNGNQFIYCAIATGVFAFLTIFANCGRHCKAVHTLTPLEVARKNLKAAEKSEAKAQDALTEDDTNDELRRAHLEAQQTVAELQLEIAGFERKEATAMAAEVPAQGKRTPRQERLANAVTEANERVLAAQQALNAIRLKLIGSQQPLDGGQIPPPGGVPQAPGAGAPPGGSARRQAPGAGVPPGAGGVPHRGARHAPGVGATGDDADAVDGVVAGAGDDDE